MFFAFLVIFYTGMEKYIKTITEDGSITYYHTGYEEHYHSIAGAQSEALYKFIIPSGLIEKSQSETVKILDVSFGLGVNALTSLEYYKNVEIFAVEKDPDICFISLQDEIPVKSEKILKNLKTQGKYHKENQKLTLRIGDARSVLSSHVISGQKYDAVFLDPFSPHKNPELWTVEFFRLLFRLLNENGLILTYSSALPVRAGFLRAGFFVGQTPAFGRKRSGTLAAKNPDKITIPLQPEEEYLLHHTTGKIPYRDYHLCMPTENIFALREKTVSRAVKLGILKTIKKGIREYQKENAISD